VPGGLTEQPSIVLPATVASFENQAGEVLAPVNGLTFGSSSLQLCAEPLDGAQELCLVIEGRHDLMATFVAERIPSVPAHHVTLNAVIVRIHSSHLTRLLFCRRGRDHGYPRVGTGFEALVQAVGHDHRGQAGGHDDEPRRGGDEAPTRDTAPPGAVRHPLRLGAFPVHGAPTPPTSTGSRGMSTATP
jgi:hypothetical protein